MVSAMTNRRRLFALAILVSLGAIAAPESGWRGLALAQTPKAGQTAAQRPVATLTSAQLAAMLRRKDFFFANVHIPYEGEIRDTDAFIVFDKIADNLDKLPKDKGRKIVLYCMSGRMSEIAARDLMRLGYTDVSHLGGGMTAWKKSGYEVIEK
jgi:rhodanese-related sulfurtransferase